MQPNWCTSLWVCSVYIPFLCRFPRFCVVALKIMRLCLKSGVFLIERKERIRPNEICIYPSVDTDYWYRPTPCILIGTKHMDVSWSISLYVKSCNRRDLAQFLKLYMDIFLVLESEPIDTVYRSRSLCSVIMNSLLPLVPIHRYDHL